MMFSLTLLTLTLIVIIILIFINSVKYSNSTRDYYVRLDGGGAIIDGQVPERHGVFISYS